MERPGSARLLNIDERHPYRAALNRGKKSVVLNLKDEADREVARRLVETADILVEGFRPGVMARLGLGWADVQAINPRLIYCSISGFGQQGPDRNRPGHDNIYTAEAGLLHENRGADGRPHLFPIQLADVGGGAFPALVGVLAALWQRERSGRGVHIDVSMLEGTLSWEYLLLPALGGGTEVTLWLESLRGDLPCYGIYATADGRYIALGALETHFWAAFCRAVGREDWLGRGYDVTLREDVAHLFRQHTLAEWVGEGGQMGILDPQEVPIAPVRTLEEVAHDASLLEAGALVRDEHGHLHPALPLRFNGVRPPAPTHVPVSGENNPEMEL